MQIATLEQIRLDLEVKSIRIIRHWDNMKIATYLFLCVGVVVMFGPVLWLIMSSFKTLSALYESNQTFLPYQIQTITISGYDKPLELYQVIQEDGQVVQMARIERKGSMSHLIDPDNPSSEPLIRPTRQLEPIKHVVFTLENYIGALQSFPFLTYLGNSLVVTSSATIITLLFNSMAAFGLSKYRYRGRNLFFIIMISTLLVPITVILIPAILVVSKLGWSNNLLGLIIPGAATPTGVFLLRQYMLSIPDELLDAARVDGAGEWFIYRAIILPLSAPAIAVLAIFSIMWRWNDFLWPLIVVTRSEFFTLPVGLNAFQGELNVQWHYIIAMTVMTLLPISVVFAFLQRFITTGIATTGLK